MTVADQILNEHNNSKGRNPIPDNNHPKPNKQQAPPPPPNPKEEEEDDIPDEVLLKNLEKKGIKVATIDELKRPEPAPHTPTPEELEEKKKEKRKNAIVYGISNDMVQEADIVNYEKESETPASELVYSIWKQEFLENIKGTEEEAEWTEDALQAQFDTEFNLSDKEGSARRKMGEKKLERLKEDYIKSKYSSVINLEKNYDVHTETTQKAQQYKGIVEKAFSGLPETLTFKVNDIDVNFRPTPEALKAVKDIYLAPQAFKTFGSIDLTPESFTKAITNSLATIDLASLIKETSESYYSSRIQNEQMGRRGIPPGINAEEAPFSSGTGVKNVYAESALEDRNK